MVHHLKRSGDNTCKCKGELDNKNVIVKKRNGTEIGSIMDKEVSVILALTLSPPNIVAHSIPHYLLERQK